MERNIYKNLIEWKQRKDHKPLVLLGARQVGKTWILKEFGKAEYTNFVYINCDKNEKLHNAFYDFDTDRLLRIFAAISGTSITPQNTLIFIDEIQEIPAAITSLKYFAEDAPEYDIVVAGSLLGLSSHVGTGYPVGKVEELTLYPLSFHEFLQACGEENLVEYMGYHYWNDMRILNYKYIDLLRQYYFVGGMPSVVSKYAESRDLKQVRRIQRQILKDYDKDFSKHVPQKLLPKVHLIWKSIPSQLAKENKKFIYGNIKTGARARDFEDAIQWLVEAGLVHKIQRVNDIKMPLNFYVDWGSFKLFVSDLGLLGAMVDAPADQVLIDNNAFIEYKGAFTEQFVAQTLVATGVLPHYYTNDKSTLEVDFVAQMDKVYPIEVKAEKNLRAKSLKSVVSKGDDLIGWRFSMADYEEQDWVINVPLYAVEEWMLSYGGRNGRE